MGSALAGPIFRPFDYRAYRRLISIVMIIKGIQTLKKLSLVPKKTVETLKEDKTYDEDPPIWYEHRHRAMNQRPCNHEERGIRAWKIA